MMTQHRESILLLLALAPLTFAFISPSSTIRPRGISPVIIQEPVLYYSNDDNDKLGADWHTLTKAAGSIATKVGSKVKHVVQAGSSKVKEMVGKGSERVKTALHIAPSKEEASTVVVDTQDEDLFRSLSDELFVVPDKALIDQLVDQAALRLQEDEETESLLGSALQYGRPFSQNSRTSTINGHRSIRTAEASFGVWGTKGQGVASIMSADGLLSSLLLEVDGQMYPIDATAPSTRTASRRHQEEWTSPVTDKEEHVIEVEVLEGGRHQIFRRGEIMDAEILYKTTF